MNPKKTVAFCLVLAMLLTALPFSVDARKKRKDGPDEPKLITVIAGQAGTIQ